jgi:hypothetical protein
VHQCSGALARVRVFIKAARQRHTARRRRADPGILIVSNEPDNTYFLPYQRAWRADSARLKICQKSRQIGLSYVDSYDSVTKAALREGRDVWVMSRDEAQAKQYIR